MPVLPLWFVHAETIEGPSLGAEAGINADLLVHAATKARAIGLWREYYADWALPEEPEHVALVPMASTEGAIAWGTLTGDVQVASEASVPVPYSLDAFLAQHGTTVVGFEAAYRAKHAENPEHYPLVLSASNSGLWLEFLLTYIELGDI